MRRSFPPPGKINSQSRTRKPVPNAPVNISTKISNWELGTGHWQLLLRSHGGVAGHALAVVAQRDVHKYVAQGSFKADHQRLDVFTGLVAFLAGEQHRRMHAEVEALVVKRADSIADDLVGQFEDGFFDQPVGFRQFRARIVTGHSHRSLRLEIQNDAALDVTRERYHAGHALAAVSVLFHREVAHFG